LDIITLYLFGFLYRYSMKVMCVFVCVCVRVWSRVLVIVFAGGVFVVLGRLCIWFFMVINLCET